MKTTSFLSPRLIASASAAAAFLAVPALYADDHDHDHHNDHHVDHVEHVVHADRAVHVEHVDRVVHVDHRPVEHFVAPHVIEQHRVVSEHVVAPRFVDHVDHHVVVHGPTFIREHHGVDVVHYHGHLHRGYVVTFGNGFHGRGYYYGPPNLAFYSAGPDVEFYATPDTVPVELEQGVTDDTTTTADTQATTAEMAVQSALADRGYYNGPIDGDIGVTSTQAIARFQADAGQPVTGTITPGLMQALGIN